jgi:polysaccharide export outer membrane protein
MALTAARQAAGQDSSRYVLGPGDSIDINVFDQPDLSRTVIIKPDGSISLPLIGDVKAAGLTTTELQDSLTQAYAKYLKSPSVSVVVTQFRTDHIFVLGQVKTPGDYRFQPGVGILEVLASAGGVTPRADLAKAVVIRNKTQTIPLNLAQVFLNGKDPQSILQPNDVVYIPETDPGIVVLGQVNKPGSYDLLPGQHVSDLLAAAGGVTQEAGLTHAFLVRGKQQTPVDLEKVMAGDATANIALQPGDMLVVPETTERIAVLGGVNRPGRYNLTQQKVTVVDAIAMAGGATDKGHLNHVQIVRMEDGKAKTITVNVQKAVQGQDVSQDVTLQSGDIVYVPTNTFLTNAFDYVNILYLARLLFGF